MTFGESLVAAARRNEITSNPFVNAVIQGEASRESIRDFAVHIVAAAESFIRSLYAILSVCDDPRVRQSLMSNVLEEEGATGFAPIEGVRIDNNRRHPVIGRKFVRATGGTEEDIANAGIGAPRWFNHALSSGDWVGPYAYIAIGVEANAPGTYSLLIRPLAEHYGLDDEALEFLVEHVTADVRHGDDGTRIIESIAVTDDMRRRALEGARRGGTAWWRLLMRHAPANQSSRNPTFIFT